MHGTCNASHVISSYDNNYGSLYATCPDQSFWLTLVALLLFVSCYASGISAVTWTVTSEIYPNWARSAANTVVYNTVNIGVLLSSVTFINFSQHLTYCGTFAIYACLSGAAGWLFVFFLLPETKGKSLEDTESIFKGSLCPPPGLKSIFKSNKITEADANTNNYH
jgi:SP family myo-inositol transporter-like MFS transporter 13